MLFAVVFVGFVAVVNGAAIQLGDGVGGSAIVVSANGSDLILTLKGANANHVIPLDVTEKTEVPTTPTPTTVAPTSTVPSTAKSTTERSNDTKLKAITTDGSSEESSESSETSDATASTGGNSTDPYTTPKPDSAVGNAPTFGLIAVLVVSLRFI